jgi:hypothetical protein
MSYEAALEKAITEYRVTIKQLRAENERLQKKCIESGIGWAEASDRADKAEADLAELKKLLDSAPVRYLDIDLYGSPALHFYGKAKGDCWNIRESNVLLVAQSKVEQIVRKGE